MQSKALIKPMKARDWLPGKLKLPCWVQPKIDGVRSLNQGGALYARSLKKHANEYVTALFSKQEFSGFDGEMIVGEDPAAKDLCRVTSGAMRRQGVDEFIWYLFDYVTEDTRHLPYSVRMHILKEYLGTLQPAQLQHIRLIDSVFCTTREEVEAADAVNLAAGYEGSCVYNPTEPHKEGKANSKMQCWRIKRFIDAEAFVTGITEGKHNANEAKTNELGRTERSTNQENMLPNGTVGSIQGTLIKDVLDPQTGEVILAKGLAITISPGKLTEAECKFYWDNPDQIVGQYVKFKLFPKGTLDKPRFPTLDSIRSKEDMEDA